MNAAGRSLADFLPLLPAEEKLREAAQRGETCKLGDTVPTTPDDTTRIRADFLRFLLLGGDEQAPVHEQGVLLGGAYIDCAVDLDFVQDVRPFILRSCNIPEGMSGKSARLANINLPASRTGPLSFDGARIAGEVFLRNGFSASGEVRFVGAEIGGNLDCSNGTFSNPEGAAKEEKEFALTCHGIKVTGNVFLKKGFSAIGEVHFVGADIGGQFVCMTSTFSHALYLTSTTIKTELWLRDITWLAPEQAHLILENTKVGVLADEEKSWPQGIVLDGFVYERFGPESPVTASARLRWLARQLPEHREGKDFRPQPYQQLAAVFRALGHESDAREIGYQKEKKLAEKSTGVYKWIINPVWGRACGYGYKPARLVWGLVGLWLLGALIYGFFPNTFKPEGMDWWIAFFYALDRMIPLFDLGLRDAWVPLGWMRFITWIHHILGVTGVILAGIMLSGVVKRD